MSTTRLTRYLQVVATALIPMTSSALGAVLNGADHGNGSIDNIAYGATGLVSLTPLLFVKAVGSTEDPNVIASSTDLSFSYRVTGFGSTIATVLYSVRNDSQIASFDDLRFIVDAQADGSNTFRDQPQIVWGTAKSGTPDHYQIADFTFDGPLSNSAESLNTLTDTDSTLCSTSNGCDADLGLQWNLGRLAPGQIWTVRVGLSDTGTTLSPNRYLQLNSIDTAGTALAFSGIAVVPESSTLIGIGLGVAVFSLIAYARRARDPLGNSALTPIAMFWNGWRSRRHGGAT